MANTSGLRYEVVEGWEQLPSGYQHRDVAGVAVDERVEEMEFGRFGWATDLEGNRFELWEPA